MVMTGGVEAIIADDCAVLRHALRPSLEPFESRAYWLLGLSIDLKRLHIYEQSETWERETGRGLS